MIERGKISAFQMGLLMYAAILATAILIVPSLTMERAGRDMWLSPVWGLFLGLALILTTHRLHALNPGQTLIAIGDRVLGRLLGKLFGFLFFFTYLHDLGFVAREYSEFVVGSFLPQTPTIFVVSCMIAVCAYAVRGGLEVIARCAQLFIPFFVFFLLLFIALLIPDFNPEHMFPMLENGIKPSIKGSLVLQSWFADFFILSFLFPIVADRPKSLRWGLLSLVAVTGTMVITNIAVLLLFGDITVGFTYPLMIATRYIALADFIEHLEAFLMAIWLLGMFVKICVYYYLLVHIAAEWLGLSDYRLIVPPLGLLVTVFSVWVTPNLQVMAQFFATSGAIYLWVVKGALPMLLLGVALVRQKAGG